MNSGKIFIMIGLVLIFAGLFLVLQRYNPEKLSFENTATLPVSHEGTTIPERVVIPAAKINLAIYPAQVKNNQWEATTKGVSFLASSSLPGEKGNAVLYGHNWAGLLGPLVKVVPGNKIQVVFSNGKTKTFIVQYISLVDPDKTQILSQTNDNRITIYTCAGFLDSKRFVVTATLAG